MIFADDAQKGVKAKKRHMMPSTLGPQTETSPPLLHPSSQIGQAQGTVEKSGPRHVVVVVLGDVGRSPRMQYHAMSLASHGVRVTMVGYTGERCIRGIEESPMVNFQRFEPPMSGQRGRRMKRSVYLLFAVLKALTLMGRLLYELVGRASRPDAILVQNPPSLPGLACVYFACLLRRCSMVLDWHNLGFTMFAGGPRHPLVWITRRAEGFFGRRAQVNLTVSHAMRDWIKRNFAISEACVVYDKPPAFFRPPTLPERHALFKKLEATSVEFSAIAERVHPSGPPRPADCTCDGDADEAASLSKKSRGETDESEAGAFQPCVDEEEGTEERTLFTKQSKDGAYELRQDRPALLVSSTSWTPDEDFSVLLEALERFDSRAASGDSPSLPFVVVVVTGKGPEKAKYVEKMRNSKMLKVAVCTAWLEPEDYPVLLGSADLGVCLHTSTSGVDLPMKVVDMFGSGVPVCAIQFDCLNELVREDVNGCVFKSSAQLALQLEALLVRFPRDCGKLDGYRKTIREVKRWEENWDQFAWPLFASLLSLSPSIWRDDPSDDGGSGGPARGCGRTCILTKRRSYRTIIVPAMVMLIVSLFLNLPRLSSRIEDLIAAAQATAERWCMWPR